MSQYWILAAIFLPILGGALLPVLPFSGRKGMRWYLETVVLITSAIVFALLAQGKTEIFHVVHFVNELSISFKIDGPSMVFAGLVAFLWPLATLYAFEYMAHEEREKTFFMFYTMTYGVTLGVAFASDMVSLYFFYELLTLVTVPLVMHTMAREAILAVRKYLYFSIGGAAFAMMGMIFMIVYGSTCEFTLGGVFSPRELRQHGDLLLWIYFFSFMGFGVKAAMFPMSGWLPQAGVAPTPVTALLHAVAVVNAGAFAILRLTYYSFGTDFLRGTWVQNVCMALAMFTIVYGCSRAVKETHIKRRLAWSTVSNLSYILFGVLVMTPQGLVGALAHFVVHGIMKFTSFLCAGAFMHQTGKKYIYEMGGMGRKMKITFGCFTVSALGLMGVPGLAGFISKWNLTEAAVYSSNPLAYGGVACLMLSALLTAIYMLSIVRRVYFPAGKGITQETADPGWKMLLPLVVCAGCTVILGFCAEPLIGFFRAIAWGVFKKGAACMNMLIYGLVFLPMVGAVLSFLTGRRSKNGRNCLVLAVAAAEFLLSLLILGRDGMTASVPGVCGFGLHFTVDGFRGIYCVIAALMWLVTTIFSPEYFAHYRNRNRYYLFWLVTLGATEAIFLSADLYTTFVFFEIMSLCSYVWVAQDEKEGALRAGGTYLAVAVIGGMVLLMGIFLLHHTAGTLVIGELKAACAGKNLWPAALCMLVGFGAKAGAFPIHIWLPKAHPVAPAPASALLSGILTKTGIFGILVISCQMLAESALWGTFVLVIGTVTMFLGAVLALFSVNFKRTLACSSVSQIGFILVGVGMLVLLGEENFLAARGTFLHMVNHSMFKLILFLVAAVIYQNTHRLELDEIRGFGRKKPLLMVCYLMGALGIGGVPGWSGYVSKTLLHEGIVEYIHGLEGGHFHGALLNLTAVKAIEWIFLISGGLTAAYMCKLFVAVFVEKNRDPAVQARFDGKKQYWNPASAAALTAVAVLIPVMGMLSGRTMDALADMAQDFLGVAHGGHAVHYFTWVNLKGSLISLAIGGVLYLLVVRKWMIRNGSYVNHWPAWLDLENLLYRPVLLRLLPGVFGWVCGIMDCLMDVATKITIGTGKILAGIMDILTDGTVVLLRKTLYRDSPERGELEEGNALTHVIGVSLNLLEELLNKTIWRHHEHRKDLEHWFVLRYASFKENATFIGRSLSLGLMLFCLGLCATLIYLLVSALG